MDKNFVRSESMPYYQQEHKDTLGENENHMEKLQLSPKFGTAQTAIEIRDRNFAHNFPSLTSLIASKSANITPRDHSVEFSSPQHQYAADFPPIGSPVSCKISPFGVANNLTNFLSI